MSYDIDLRDPVTKETIFFDESHQIRGGSYPIGGTNKAEFNITYNYAPVYYKLMGEKGIRTIYGMSGAESIPVIESTISQLKNDISDDYWESTEGNAKRALYGLLAFAKMRPDGIWDGD